MHICVGRCYVGMPKVVAHGLKVHGIALVRARRIAYPVGRCQLDMRGCSLGFRAAALSDPRGYAFHDGLENPVHRSTRHELDSSNKRQKQRGLVFPRGEGRQAKRAAVAHRLDNKLFGCRYEPRLFSFVHHIEPPTALAIRAAPVEKPPWSSHRPLKRAGRRYTAARTASGSGPTEPSHAGFHGAAPQWSQAPPAIGPSAESASHGMPGWRSCAGPKPMGCRQGSRHAIASSKGH